MRGASRHAAKGAKQDALEARRVEMLSDFYRILALTLGAAKQFAWRYATKDGKIVEGAIRRSPSTARWWDHLASTFRCSIIRFTPTIATTASGTAGALRTRPTWIS